MLTCKTNEQMTITIQLSTDIDSKRSASGKAARWALRPKFSCSCQVSGAQRIRKSDNRKLIEGCLISCFVFFQILVN